MNSESENDIRASTPLMEAVLLDNEQESLQWTKELLEAGEDPNQLDPAIQRTPLFAAWWNDRTDLIKLLLNFGGTGNVDVGSFDEVMIGSASIQNSILLCEAGFRFDSGLTKNQLGEIMCESYTNPLEYFLEYELWDHIKAFGPYGLLNLIHAYDGMLGMQPLACMARDGLVKQAKWLIDHGADVNAHCEGMIGSTALDCAVGEKRLDMIKLLLNEGANPNIPTWMWISATDRVSRYGPAKVKGHHDATKDSDLVEIKGLVLDACKKFPPPFRPDGSKASPWPPEYKAK